MTETSKNFNGGARNTKKQTEVDFICNQADRRYYIQVALSLPTREKTLQEEDH